MTNIFTICHNLAKNAYSKVKGFVSTGAGDVKATSEGVENFVKSPNDGTDTRGTAKWYNLTIKSIFENILSVFQVDNSKSEVSQPQDENFDPPTSNTIEEKLQIYFSDPITIDSKGNIIKQLASALFPSDKTAVVTTESFRLLPLDTPSSSVRSVLDTLPKADNESIKENLLKRSNDTNIKIDVDSIPEGSQPQDENFDPPTSNTIEEKLQIYLSDPINIASQDDVIKQLRDAINPINTSNFTKALDDLEYIPNETLAKELPEECIEHFISTGLPLDRTKVVTTELFKSLLATPGSSVRSVLYTLGKADIFFIEKADIGVLIDTYKQALLKTNMPYRTFDSDNYSYQIIGDEVKKLLKGDLLTPKEEQILTYMLIGCNPPSDDN
jgi:hypothetical protein